MLKKDYDKLKNLKKKQERLQNSMLEIAIAPKKVEEVSSAANPCEGSLMFWAIGLSVLVVTLMMI